MEGNGKFLEEMKIASNNIMLNDNYECYIRIT